MNQLNPVPGKRKKKIGAPADRPEQRMPKGNKSAKILSDEALQKRIRKGKKAGRGNELIDVPQAKRKKRKRIGTGDSSGAKPVMYSMGGKVKGYNKGGMCGASMPPARPVKKA